MAESLDHRRVGRWVILLPVGYAALILIGGLLIRLPMALEPGRELTPTDATLTVTGAVCMTGLTVHDTATHFSTFGKILIAILIQTGGPGMLVFGAVFAAMLTGRPVNGVRRLILFVAATTLGLELLGAAAMVPLWQGDMSVEQRLGHSLFHAISAFCNAGFSTFSDSLVSHRYSMLTHGIIAPLVVLGGLGYPVLSNLWRRRLSLHTRIALTTTFSLYLYGVVIFGAGQLAPVAAEHLKMNVTANRTQPVELTRSRLGAMLADASFMSLTARSTGFHNIPMEDIQPAGAFGLITLMLIGGSPGGAAGGIRTVTFAVLVLTIIATLRGRDGVEVFGRKIPESIVRLAVAMVACHVLLITVTALILCLIEPFPFLKLLFEATSAATVSGLSLGITAELSNYSKMVLIAAMFLGRVGPLVLLAMLAFGSPKEDVVII